MAASPQSLAQALAAADAGGIAPPEGAAAALPPGGAELAPLGGMPPAANPYPTADPNFIAEQLAMIIQAQQQDHAQLAQDQQAALVGNPLFEALVSGAPLQPGMGQDAQGIGPETPLAPAPQGF